MASDNQRFSRDSRLLSPEQFGAALRSRPLARGELLTFHWCSALPTDLSNIDTPKLGFVVPKRLVRLSVRRNAIKRVLREAFRLSQASLCPGYYVFRLKAGVRSQSLTGLKREIRVEADRLISTAASRS